MEEKLDSYETEVKEKPSLFGMIMSPSTQFERIRNHPKIWVALLIVTVFMTIGTVLTLMAADLTAGMTEEELGIDEGLLSAIAMITGVVMGVITPIITILIFSAILIAIAKIAQSDVTFKQLFSMNTYISFIGAIGITLNGLLSLLLGIDNGVFITSLAGLLNSDSAVLSSFEIFGIWNTILTAIGLNKVAKLSKGLSWTIAIAFFVISLGFAIIGSAAGALGGM